jgi:Nuclease-related domain
MLPRTKPWAILCYEALFRWLHPHLRENKQLQDDHASYRAGFYGEKNSDYIVFSYPHKNAYIYQGLRLKIGPFHFQIDTLIVTPNFILILEVKNFKGELEYNPTTQQLIQYDGEGKRTQKNPILQAETQKRHLTLWLRHFGYPPIPIETAAVSTNPSAILRTPYEGTGPIKFVQLDSLPIIFDNLYQSFSKPAIDQITIKKMNKKLLQEHHPHKPDLIKQFGITNRHLVKGVPCTKCEFNPLEYRNKVWKCSRCGYCEPNAHERKILDYFLLIQPTISNKECRKLLQIDSPKVTRRLLQSMNLKNSGKNYSSIYHSPTLEDFPQDSPIPINKRSIFND